MRNDLYKILQVQPDADPAVIEAAWKALMKKHHPDRGGRASFAAELDNAKSLLMDVAKRREYDLKQMVPDDIVGSYKIMKQIGEGGFGRVFQAEHIRIGEYACLKQNRDATREAAEMLCLESKLLWKLSDYHSIPAAKEFYELGDNNYVMVMNFIDGKTLDEVVKKHGRLHPEDACWITERLLGALYYCHSNGVIHSDVKPENVFVEPQKQDIKLIDFGLAAYKPTSGTKPVGYTPRYAAPELALNKPPIPETDIYGAGVVMLYALGGDIDKRSLPGDVPEGIADYCSKLIRYDPTERPNWERDNPLQGISDLREKAFGRRHRK